MKIVQDTGIELEELQSLLQHFRYSSKRPNHPDWSVGYAYDQGWKDALNVLNDWAEARKNQNNL